jgi:hypothetical protein
MYAMKAMASSVFRTMMFPHNEKIITIDQISHYKPNHSTNIDNILPLVRTSLMLIHSLTWASKFSRSHPCWGNTLEHHLSYILQHKCVAYILMALTPETPFLPLRPLHTSMSHQLKKFYLRDYLRTLLHHLSHISLSLRGKSWFWRQSPKPSLRFPSSIPHQEYNNFR